METLANNIGNTGPLPKNMVEAFEHPKALTQRDIERIHTELESPYPSICMFSVIHEEYYKGEDDIFLTPEDFWRQRFTFLLIVLAAEGEL